MGGMRGTRLEGMHLGAWCELADAARLQVELGAREQSLRR